MASTRPCLDITLSGGSAPAVRLELLTDLGPKHLAIASHVADLVMQGLTASGAVADASGCLQFGRGPAPGSTPFPLLGAEGVEVPRNAAGMPAPKSLPKVAPNEASANLGSRLAPGAAPFTCYFDPKEATGVWFMTLQETAAVPEAMKSRWVPFAYVVAGVDALQEALAENGAVDIDDAHVVSPSNAVEGVPTAVVPSASSRVRFETSAGDFTVELLWRHAPVTVASFVDLVAAGFYDGQHVHRLIAGFVVQMGCPISKDPKARQAGSGGPAPGSVFEALGGNKVTRSAAGGKIPDEHSARVGNLKFTLSMANGGSANSAGSQFFVNLGDNTKLDWFNSVTSSAHVVFAVVTEGFDTIGKIGAVTANVSTDRPNTPIKLVRVSVN
jgi:cyclophilin family peptidyl-prolyl cis-trans isomerase